MFNGVSRFPLKDASNIDYQKSEDKPYSTNTLEEPEPESKFKIEKKHLFIGGGILLVIIIIIILVCIFK